jgi:hypothetical protein
MIIPYIFLPKLEEVGLLGPWGNEWVRCAGIKVIVDGAIAVWVLHMATRRKATAFLWQAS